MVEVVVVVVGRRSREVVVVVREGEREVVFLKGAGEFIVTREGARALAIIVDVYCQSSLLLLKEAAQLCLNLRKERPSSSGAVHGELLIAARIHPCATRTSCLHSSSKSQYACPGKAMLNRSILF